MAFRFWAMRRWVFPDHVGGDNTLERADLDKALESTLTAGGIAEVLEDLHHDEVAIRRRRRRTKPAA
jgi:hypothetical protein